jgi:hypothetical protein
MGEKKRRVQLGPTGQFPGGMIRQDDQGSINIAISDMDSHGNIHIDFGTPVAWVALPAEQAINLARLLLRKAGAKSVEITL